MLGIFQLKKAIRELKTSYQISYKSKIHTSIESGFMEERKKDQITKERKKSIAENKKKWAEAVRENYQKPKNDPSINSAISNKFNFEENNANTI